MPRDEAYRIAEQKIEAARKSGAKELDLSGDYGERTPKLTELPESLDQLTQLQSLNLSSNQLTALPESLDQLTQLQSLNLSSNQLTALPESLGQLAQLQSLDLSSNRLTALPESLGQLTQLTYLHLYGNELEFVPSAIGGLTQLKTLWLGKNKLAEVPRHLNALLELRQLSFAENQRIAHVPEWLGDLRLMETLYFHGNQISSLPNAVGNLTNLRELYLSSNKLCDLPSSLSQLGKLKAFRLENNPLNPELSAADKEGLDAVKRYLRAKAAGDQVVLNEAKLILIGEGEVGKSCLLGALRGDKWVEGRDTTHGIEIKPVKVTDPDSGTEITLNGWDFGGQRVYRPTHQLFFSAPAVYLVVWKPRQGPQQGFVKEWIKLSEGPRAGGQNPRGSHARRSSRTPAGHRPAGSLGPLRQGDGD